VSWSTPSRRPSGRPSTTRPPSGDPGDRAAGLLTHYFRIAFRGAGLDWDADNESEMQILTDAMQEMVADEIRDHVEDAPHLYPDGSSR
jgi:hypothetical protein